MVKATVTLRDPGNHRVIWTGEIQAVPREGEWIVLPGEESARPVHAVTYDFGDGTVDLLVK